VVQNLLIISFIPVKEMSSYYPNGVRDLLRRLNIDIEISDVIIPNITVTQIKNHDKNNNLFYGYNIEMIYDNKLLRNTQLLDRPIDTTKVNEIIGNLENNVYAPLRLLPLELGNVGIPAPLLLRIDLADIDSILKIIKDQYFIEKNDESEIILCKYEYNERLSYFVRKEAIYIYEKKERSITVDYQNGLPFNIRIKYNNQNYTTIVYDTFGYIRAFKYGIFLTTQQEYQDNTTEELKVERTNKTSFNKTELISIANLTSERDKENKTTCSILSILLKNGMVSVGSDYLTDLFPYDKIGIKNLIFKCKYGNQFNLLSKNIDTLSIDPGDIDEALSYLEGDVYAYQFNINGVIVKTIIEYVKENIIDGKRFGTQVIKCNDRDLFDRLIELPGYSLDSHKMELTSYWILGEQVDHGYYMTNINMIHQLIGLYYPIGVENIIFDYIGIR